MKEPLFAIGEEVVLQSIIDSGYNGEYKVIACMTDKLGFKYTLANLEKYSVFEESLKKKHKPSELSFSKLKELLKVGTVHQLHKRF